MQSHMIIPCDKIEGHCVIPFLRQICQVRETLELALVRDKMVVHVTRIDYETELPLLAFMDQPPKDLKPRACSPPAALRSLRLPLFPRHRERQSPHGPEPKENLEPLYMPGPLKTTTSRSRGRSSSSPMSSSRKCARRMRFT